MNIEYFETPAPHIIIKNYFSEDELPAIWQELDFLTYEHKLLSPNITSSATNVDGKNLKNNHGIFLDEIYPFRNISNILTITRKLFHGKIINELMSKHFIFNYIKKSNQDSTLLSYYQDQDYYLPHNDSAVLSAVINLYREPAKFTGGDFYLGSEDYKIPLENNRMILFPSCIMHSVSSIEFLENLPKFSGFGRYTITQFLCLGIEKDIK